MRISSSMHARSIACGSRARHDVATRVAARGALALTALLAAAAGLCDAATTPLNPAAVNATSVPWEHMQFGSAGACLSPQTRPRPRFPLTRPGCRASLTRVAAAILVPTMPCTWTARPSRDVGY